MYAKNDDAEKPGDARRSGVEEDIDGRSIWRRRVSNRVAKNRFNALCSRQRDTSIKDSVISSTFSWSDMPPVRFLGTCTSTR